MNENTLDAAQIGKMFVVKVLFDYHEESTSYDSRTGKYNPVPAHWDIKATLNDKPQQYGSTQTMSIQVEHGIGQKLVEVLLPVIIADASIDWMKFGFQRHGQGKSSAISRRQQSNVGSIRRPHYQVHH